MKENTFLRRIVHTASRLLCAFFFILPLGYMLLSPGIFGILTRNSYYTLLQWYTQAFPEAFDSGTMAGRCYTPAWHEWLWAHREAGNVLLAAMPVAYLVFGRRAWRWSTRLAGEIRRGLAFLGSGLSGCSSSEKAMFFLLTAGVLAYRLYFYFSFPLHTDELCSYLYFVKPGFFIAVTSYPLPNNHVLFNVCCSLLNLIPGLSPKAVMRLPSIAGDLFLLYSIFCLLRRWDGYQRAIVVVTGVAFCYLTSYYAVQGRGYQWQEVCALVSAFSCWECFRGAGRGERRGSALFIVSSAAGFYINPVFLYHFMALGLLCLFYFIRARAYKDLIFWGKCVCVIMGLVFICYLPLILISSWRALAANEYLTGMKSYRELFSHFSEFTFILKDMSYYGTVGMYFLLVCVVLLLVAYGRKMIGGAFYDHLSAYLFALLVSLTLWALYEKQYPLERCLCFWALALNIVFVNACYDLLKRYFVRGAYWLMAAFLAVKIAGSLRGLYWERFAISSRKDVKVAREVKKDILQLAALRPTSWQITDSDDFYSMYLREYLICGEEKDHIWFSRTEVLGDIIFLPDRCEPSFSLKGYTLWSGGKITAHGKLLRIYVLSSLMVKKDDF